MGPLEAPRSRAAHRYLLEMAGLEATLSIYEHLRVPRELLVSLLAAAMAASTAD
jgi:hypothetical protein